MKVAAGKTVSYIALTSQLRMRATRCSCIQFCEWRAHDSELYRAALKSKAGWRRSPICVSSIQPMALLFWSALHLLEPNHDSGIDLPKM